MSSLEEVSIPFHQGVPREQHALEGVLELPDVPSKRSVVLLAHGSGSGKDSEFLSTLSAGLAEQGFPVLRFDYLYMQRARETGKRRPPDRRLTLEKAHIAALRVLAQRFPKRRILLAGKSLGGRIGSYLAAEDTDFGLAAGLVFFGYPLHPRKQPDKIRDEHFPTLAIPALFFQGTRDELCDLDLLQASLSTYGGAASVEVIEAADHGFDVQKRSGRTHEEVREQLISSFVRWESETFPDSRPQ